MAVRFASCWAAALLISCLTGRGALAQSGSCCLPSGGCIITTSASCTGSTNKGVYVGNPTCTPGLLGDCYPDIWLVNLQDATQWGRAQVNSQWVHSFSFGTYSCNHGTTNAIWIGNNNQHPVITQDLFRILNGRIEHIGMAWVKHGFFALQNIVAGCGSCPWPDSNNDSLAVGCADPYSASGENGTRTRLGPRSHINPTTGVFQYPATWPPYQTSDPLARRLQVYESDLNNAGATYWVQGQYVTPDDAQAGKALDNASYRRVSFGPATTFTPAMVGSTVTRTPVIYAWRDNGLGAGVPDPDVVVNSVDVSGDGRYFVASKATDLGGGMWHYEYAVQNHNSNRAGGGFSVPIGSGSTVSNTGFHAPFWHSGEFYDNTPWAPTVSSSSVRWDPAPLPVPNPQNLQTNAIRFATLYNFRFDTNAQPTTGQITLTLLEAGSPASVTVNAVVPTIIAAEGACCASDGTCSLTTSAACLSPSVFLGIPSSCTPTECDGACCAIDGTCSLASSADCSGDSLFLGVVTVCQASSCDGACCAPDGSCTVTSAASCTGPNLFLGILTACAPDACNGACCAADGTCTIAAAADCTGTSIYRGPLTPCVSNTCSGACCTGGVECSIVENAAACAGGQFTPVAVCNPPGNRVAPCCHADFNGDGNVTVQDLFDFLAAFFADSLEADMDGGGTVSVQDLFTFLALWFAKC